MTESTEAATIERLVRAAAAPIESFTAIDGKQVLAVRDGYTATTHAEESRPLHHVKTTTVHNTLESLVSDLQDYETDGTTIFVDLERCEISAIIDGDIPPLVDEETGEEHAAQAGWKDHRALFAPVETEEWKTLVAHLNRPLGRDEFRELVVKMQRHIVIPDVLEVFQVAEQFNVSSRTEFVEGESSRNGARHIQFVEEHTATAGGTGSIEVPEVIEFALAQFIDSSVHSMPCQFRWKVREGHLTVRLDFLTLEDLKRETFTEYEQSLRIMVPDIRRVMGSLAR